MDYFNTSDNYSTMGYHRSRSTKYLGDRVATVLFYVSRVNSKKYISLYSKLQLSDVEQGGATVFPGISAVSAYTIYPRAGTAVMWYNLHTDGIGDQSTMHVACPVIVGSKWGENINISPQSLVKNIIFSVSVMTQWIRERSQIFVRPCLEPSASLSPT